VIASNASATSSAAPPSFTGGLLFNAKSVPWKVVSLGQIVPGAQIYDITGVKVGSVSSVNLSNEYITLEKGVLSTRDFYVPLSAVERTEPEGVYLNVDKDQMAYLGWDERPNDETIDSASSLSVEDEDRQS
jgi:hypothetical protein